MSPSGVRIRVLLLVAACGMAAWASLAVGAVAVPASAWWSLVSGGPDALPALERYILLEIRLPRVVAAVACGGLLGMAGAALQGLFRNPLADPGLLGVSTGSALGAALLITFAAPAAAAPVAARLALPASAFAGGLLVTLIVWAWATRANRTLVHELLLAGIALNAMSGAALGFVLYIANDDALRAITFWTLGSLGNATWVNIAATLPFLAMALGLLLTQGRWLNSLALGESEAASVGVPVQRTKVCVVLGTALGLGSAVSLVGGIGFVGLVAPHIVRLWLGPDQRRVVPASGLLGALLLLLADIAARRLAPPRELPIGILLAFIGAPLLLHLLRSRRAAQAA